jgi:phosphate transport system substrate-binding protein
MNKLKKSRFHQKKLLSLSIGLGMTLLACAPPQTNKPIKIDGSSTVYPITKAVADAYKGQNQNSVKIDVDFSGTTGGFRKFCEGKTDVSNASRPIDNAEISICNNNKVRFIELPIAFDALTVVVNPANKWAENLTTEDLRKMWQPDSEGKVKRWNQIRADLPDKPLNLFGAGADSGTFDYFTEAIVGKPRSSRLDYVQTEDDKVTVQGVEQDPNALGYFGLAYYEANAKHLKAVAIDSGKGAVLPSRETVEKSEYQPLSRPLFIYINLATAQDNPALRDFVEFYLKKAPEIVPSVGYIPLPAEGYHLGTVTFQNGEAGTVFEGKSQIGLTIGELLRKKAKF